MDIELIQKNKADIVQRFGAWTAHNIQLAEDVYTIDHRIVGDELKLRRILQMTTDLAGGQLGQLRVLDLACLEGLYSVEMARHGAQVVGIEGREANIAKARFAKEVLGLANLEFVQDDVRNLSRQKYGEFDVILCLGILYHLDVPDVFTQVERIAECCKRFAIIDTHISLSGELLQQHNGRDYRGHFIQEHAPAATAEQRAKSLWASLDNVRSFWFTRASLLNLLAHTGFTSVYECFNPAEIHKPADRITLLALKGQPQTLLASPLTNALPHDDWPEQKDASSGGWSGFVKKLLG